MTVCRFQRKQPGRGAALLVAICIMVAAGLAVVRCVLLQDNHIQELNIASFRDERDLLRVITNNAGFELTDSRVTPGRRSLCTTFSGGAPLSSIVIMAPFSDVAGSGDWRGYHALRLSLYSRADRMERLLVQVKDRDGKPFKTELLLPPQSPAVLQIPLDSLAGSIDVRHIDSLTLFRWQAEKPLTVYLEEISLLSAAASK